MASVTYTVPNKNGSYDGDMVVKQYTSIAIDAGDTVTVDQPCRGLVIYCKGNATINGTLHMNQKGANTGNPANTAGGSDSNTVQPGGLIWPYLDNSGGDTITSSATLLNGAGTTARTAVANHPSLSGNGTGYKVAVVGGAGGNPSGGRTDGQAGSPGAPLNSTGGGGGGGGGHSANIAPGQGNSYGGVAGSCFAGGSGGGGAGGYLGGIEYQAGAFGGAGARGKSGGGGQPSGGGGGGAGNPGGDGGTGSGGPNGSSGNTGNGGVLCLFVGGDLTIGPAGVISADGINGGAGGGPGSYGGGGGGGSGGGRVIVLYKGTLTNNGNIRAQGGGTASSGWGQASSGASGGNGAVTTAQVL